MKQLSEFIQEKLHVSQYKGLTPKIAEYFGISNKAADIIVDKYLDINIDFKNDQCTDFEGVFLLAAYLAHDKMDGKELINLGTIDYHGNSDPLSIKWYRVEDDWIGTDYFSYIQEHYGVEEDTGDPEFRKIFDEMVEFCKENKIDPNKVLNYSKEFK